MAVGGTRKWVVLGVVVLVGLICGAVLAARSSSSTRQGTSSDST